MMRSDSLIKNDGLQILSQQLGIVEAERFITLIRRESFNYTVWQRSLFEGVPLDDLLKNAAEYRNRMENT